MNTKVVSLLVIIVAVVASALMSAQNAVAQNDEDMVSNTIAKEIQVEETILSENDIMTTNQTTDGNMTGTNSTS
ncbi:MAG: hypothetical protein WBX01_11745 [Nitrososphaeraceae archaeon]